jgi:hypothetical protein
MPKQNTKKLAVVSTLIPNTMQHSTVNTRASRAEMPQGRALVDRHVG